jgi:hypothetical protein
MELDHVFICTDPGAPEAEKLVAFGLHEGPASSMLDKGLQIGVFLSPTRCLSCFG